MDIVTSLVLFNQNQNTISSHYTTEETAHNIFKIPQRCNDIKHICSDSSSWKPLCCKRTFCAHDSAESGTAFASLMLTSQQSVMKMYFLIPYRTYINHMHIFVCLPRGWIWKGSSPGVWEQLPHPRCWCLRVVPASCLALRYLLKEAARTQREVRSQSI